MILNGLFYLRLKKLVEILAPVNIETIRQLLQRNSHKGFMNWRHGMKMQFWRRLLPPTPKGQIKHFEVDGIQDSYFEVTSLASITSLDKLDISEIELTAFTVESEKVGFKILRHFTMADIRVA